MDASDSMPRHPIRVAAQRTGLTPATIRAWERRYGAVRPSRSEGGQRLYSDQDVERLTLLRDLTDVGRPISMVAGLSDEEAHALLLEDRAAAALPGPSTNGEAPAGFVEEAYAFMLELDARGMERSLWRAAMSLDGRAFLDEVVAPLLELVGAGWEAGEVSPGQEHLGSDVVDRVLARFSDPARSPEGPCLVVATLAGERHGLGARLVSATAAVDGWSVTYLGTDLPVADIAAAANRVGASAVAISVVTTDRLGEVLEALTTLRELLTTGVDVLVGGRGAGSLEAERLPGGIAVFDGLEGLRQLRRHG